MTDDWFAVGPRGVALKVKARPGSRSDAVIGPRAGELVVEVRARAEKGKANTEIVKLLAKTLGVPRDSVTLKLGAGSHHKVFVVPPAAVPALEKLRSLTGESGGVA